MQHCVKTLFLSAFMAFGALYVQAAKSPAATVRSIAADNIPADLITVPESFEADTHKLMQNWYLRSYTDMDKSNTTRNISPSSEQDYIDRLQSLPTAIEMPYNKVVRTFIDMYCERKKTLVEAMLGMSLYYMPIFEQALDKHNMPLELKYLPVIESALNPNAVSSAGATGLWQFMLSTAKGEGLEINSLVDQRRDPYASSDAAARYLKKLYNTYNDWSLAIAAYNCGPGNVNKAIRRAGGGKKDFWEIYPFLPSETRSYVPAFIAATYAMNFYQYHGISPALAARPIVTDSVHVTRRVHFKQISDVLGVPMDELRVLNPQYRQDLIPGDIRPYPLVLPNLQAYCYLANEDSVANYHADLYARRDVVEPSSGRSESEVSGDGEYVTETVVKYHKVRRGETLKSIARRYGVTVSSIKRANNIRRKVRRGQTIKITTYTRRWVPSSKPDGKSDMADNTPAGGNTDTQTNPTGNTTDNTSTADKSMDANGDNITTSGNSSDNAPASTSKPDKKTTAKPKPQYITHTIAAGENLSKIARKYGVTVDQIKQANGLKSDNIQQGKTLKIPQKSSSKSKKSSKKKSRRRRR